MPINNFLLPGAKFTPAYEVANSCRFDDGSSAYMHKTPGSAGDQQKFTFSFWIKRCGITTGTAMTIFDTEADDDNQFKIRFNDNGTLTVESKVSDHNDSLITNDLYRDPSAWMNFVIAFDTTQGTASNRFKIYHNGTQITSFGTENYPAEDLNTLANAANKLYVGTSAQTDAYCDMYIAEFCLVDGQQLAATSFGEFDEDSPTIWKPIDVSGLTFGTNGFYLDFEDSANLGNDKNGGTDLTEVNLAATDSATDSPTNNFATWNPLAQTPQKGTIAEGNLEYDRSGSSDNWVTIASTIAATAGKWYYEYKIIDGGSSTGNGSLVGFLDYNTSAFQHTANDAITNAGEYAWYGASGNLYINGTDVAQVDSYTDDDIVMVAMDLDNSKAYWGKNGTWIDSGDPTSGATGTGARDIANVSSGTFAFAVSHREGGNGQANFGNPPFSISSGNADDNDYGNFEYDVPTGYLALCTKNLGSDGG